MKNDIHAAFWPTLALAITMLTVQAFSQKVPEKPRVPPGVDPGGVAVAIIGSGIDYTNPEIAKRLARDGEGEIVGWDFVDNDRRPYYRCTPAGCPPCISLVPEPDPRLRPDHKLSYKLVFLRVAPERPQTLVEAVQTAERMGTRIVVLSVDMQHDGAFLIEAARRHPRMLFVADVKHGTAIEALQQEPENLFARDDKIAAKRIRLAERLVELVAQNPTMGFTEIRKAVWLPYWSEQDRRPIFWEQGNQLPPDTNYSVRTTPGCPTAP